MEQDAVNQKTALQTAINPASTRKLNLVNCGPQREKQDNGRPWSWALPCILVWIISHKSREQDNRRWQQNEAEFNSKL